jgi:tRNA nucleotidyltransferase (CCA-adding enzyme)
MSKVERLVVVDTRQPERLGLVAPVLSNPGLDIHLYDHHPDAPGDLSGSYSHVEPMGATVTLMIEAIRERGLNLSPQEATMLALGLYEDTGAFTYSSTTARDLLAGAFLLSAGADLQVVSELTSRELKPDQLALLNELILAAETRESRGHCLALSMARRESRVEDLAVLASKMMEIMDLDSLFLLVEMESMVQLVARSRKGGIDAGEIARALGGGGHASAAAAAVKGQGLAEVRARLEKALSEYIGRLFSAGSIMVHPPISLPSDRQVAEARELMLRFSLNVVLAEDSQGRVAGFITEHSASKAAYHGLSASPLKDFMISDFLTVRQEASFGEVKRIVVDLRQRILPVTDAEGRAIGVITRTDLLQLLAAEAGGEEGQGRSSGSGRERNLAELMAERLPERVNGLLSDLGRLADGQGFSLWLVGGTVRDLVMLKPIRDLDLALGGDLEAFVQVIREAYPDVQIKPHPRFKTATLYLGEGFRLDLSTARLEYYEKPGALPVVRKASIQLDLQRRDFTVNSLALSLGAADYGRLLDFFRGYQDIKDGYIRILHSLSFIEDPTRAFRAVRFETRLGFRISKMTAGLIENAVSGGFVANMQPRRVMAEIRLVCQEEEPGLAFKRLSEFGLLKGVHPDLRVTKRHMDLFKKVDKVRDWFRLSFADSYSPIWLVYFLALVEELPQPDIMALSELFEGSQKIARVLVSELPLLKRIGSEGGKYGQDPIKPSQADQIFGSLSWPGILYVMAKTNGRSLARAGAAFLTIYRRVRSNLDGGDLIHMGLDPGPGIQKTLDELRTARLDGLVGSIEEERDYVSRRLAEGQLPEGEEMEDTP